MAIRAPVSGGVGPERPLREASRTLLLVAETGASAPQLMYQKLDAFAATLTQ